jgi:competence protein ComEC
MLNRDSIEASPSVHFLPEIMLPWRGKLLSLPVPRNPGEFDAAPFELNDVNAKMLVPSGGTMVALDAGPFSVVRWAVIPARISIGAAIDRYFRGEEARFLKGLLIGERTEVPMEVKTSFINAGVMHILAVSGLHVAVVVMMIFGCADILHSRRYAMILSIPALIYYNFLAGGAASVTRSVIMAIVYLCGQNI